MLKNIKIRYKLALMVAIPILGLIYFTINSTLGKREIVNQMNLLQALSELAVKSSSLVHELQKERGLSAGFLGSQGSHFSTELIAQRVKTDKVIKELDSFLKDFNLNPFSKELQSNLETTFSALHKIKTQRNLVNQLEASATEQIRYYAMMIDSLLTGINHLSKVITHAELSNRVMAYVNLLQAKEKAGMERAILNNTFSQGYFAPGVYNEFILLIGAQDIYIKNFFFFATPSQQRLYHEIMPGEFVDGVKAIRLRAFNKQLKLKLTADLQNHLGYGGLIHQFKNYILRGEPKYIEAFHQQYQQASRILARCKKLTDVSQSDLKNIEVVENSFANYNKQLTLAIALKQQQKSVDEIDAFVKIYDAPAIKALNSLLSSSHLDIESTDWWKMTTGRINLFKVVEDQVSADLSSSASTLKKDAQSVFIFSLIITGGTILLTLFVSYIFAGGITNPLKSLVNVAHKISAGERNIEIIVNSKDETGELSHAMAKMLDAIAIQKLEIRERKLAEVKLGETVEAYARFVPNEFLQLLNKDRILDIQLGNHLEMDMTVLFSDIRSFTSLSEKMSPQENFDFINVYLKEMGPLIRTHQGFIDKYIGDAIMALFLRADDALNAAIAMLHGLDKFNNTLQHQGVTPIKIGIGLNTGKLMLGIVGEENRLQGTVMSDTVNLASRIECLTKTYQCSLLISQNTLDNLTVPSQYAIRFLDTIKVKGRYQQSNIFEVFDGEPTEVRKGKLATLTTFEKAVHLYQEQQFSEVQKLMEACLHLDPVDAAAKIYIQRCHNFLKIDHSENWAEIAKVVKWTPDLSVNNQTIDEQHQELFIRIKGLIMSIGSGKTDETVAEMMNFLENYVITHFATEEQYMKQYDYPHYAAHKAQHLQFRENVYKLKQDYQTRGGHLHFILQIQREIVDWLIYHIGQSDTKLGQFLKDKH
ncbi:MAG: hypothetical protein DRR19_15595 [Candidatus Parabeggiatoa sp. nov. 1]|nr:MAG: hypothetical protein DRR19_15595 [Gammaproteobacteria bacterium]